MYPNVPHYPVPNYLAGAILVTLFCCLPFGIVAIVYAAQANSAAKRGSYNEAMESARKAKFWTWLSFGIGLAGTLLYFLIMILAAAADSGPY